LQLLAPSSSSFSHRRREEKKSLHAAFEITIERTVFRLSREMRFSARWNHRARSASTASSFSDCSRSARSIRKKNGDLGEALTRFTIRLAKIGNFHVIFPHVSSLHDPRSRIGSSLREISRLRCSFFSSFLHLHRAQDMQSDVIIAMHVMNLDNPGALSDRSSDAALNDRRGYSASSRRPCIGTRLHAVDKVRYI